MSQRPLSLAALLGLAGLSLLSASASAAESFIGPLSTVSVVSSTVPANGDVNPYGIVVVERTTGSLVRGNVLVSNFNNSANAQGTGTTIVQISPQGNQSTFAELSASSLPGACPGGVGLTTALTVLRSGWVVVGSLPTADGTSATAQAGCLIVLNSMGQPVETISGGPINGPWDMTAVDRGERAVLFVANVLNGTVAASPNVVNQGAIVRLSLALDESAMPRVTEETVIASGFPERTDPGALVIGPTGLAVTQGGRLFVADTLGNRIAEIDQAFSRKADAGAGTTFSSAAGLNGPLGLTLLPGGHLLAANAGDGNLVEIDRQGVQVALKTVDATGAGTLFGLTPRPEGRAVYFVDDGTNTLNLLHGASEGAEMGQ